MNYERQDKFKCIEVPNIGYRLEGELKDDLHHLRISILVDYWTQEIIEAHAEAVETPFPICQQAMKSIENLIGKRVGVGFSKVVNMNLIGPEGCIHLAELVISTVRAGIQGPARQVPNWVPKDEFARRWLSWEQLYIGRCIHYAQPNINTMEAVLTEVIPKKRKVN